MQEPPFSTVTIYGPGLLGGSVALAVRDRLPSCELRLWARREQPLALANSLGIEHTYTDARAAAQGADLIIFATPIGAFEELARLILPAISKQALVTDVGSVKAYVHRTTGELLTDRGRMFIGSHPMAGAETQGLEHATPTLLDGATVAITNPHGVPTEMEVRLSNFWQALGCHAYSMHPAHHDKAVARISHMPHIMAALGARNAKPGEVPLPDLQRLASSGFRDTTRVCSGAAGMWADILWENDVAIRQVLTNCVNDLHRLIFLLEDQDKAGVLRWLTTARDTRETILGQQAPSTESPDVP